MSKSWNKILSPLPTSLLLVAVAAGAAAAAWSMHLDVESSKKSSSGSASTASSDPVPVEDAPDPDDHSDLGVLVRDENPGDRTALRLRLVVKNRSHHPIHGFRLEMPFRTHQLPVAEGWYAPGCHVSAKPDHDGRDDHDDHDAWTLRVSCRELDLPPGQSWPEKDGMSIGLHDRDWHPFDAKEDFHFGRDLRPTRRIKAWPE
jgi:hypothetical protein